MKRRLRIYRVDEQLLYTMFADVGTVRRYCVIEGPPSDAKLVSLDKHWETNSIKLKYEHPSFEECADGQAPPEYRFEVMLTGDFTGEQTTELRRALKTRLRAGHQHEFDFDGDRTRVPYKHA